MKIEDAYNEYKLKAEKNITNDGLSTDKGRFCMRFNDKQVSYLRNLLQNKGSDDIRYAEKFLKTKFPIPFSSKTKETYVFDSPEKFFDIGDISAIVSSGKCKNETLNLYETSPENYTEALRNENTKPSFKWRESIFTLSENSVKVFYDDFTVDKILLTYYRYPQNIVQEDPDDPESQFDESIPIEWDEQSMYRIIDLCVLDNDISSNNPRTQTDILRINS